MKKLNLMILLLFMGYMNAQAQFISGISKTGTTAASFLEIGVGPKAVAMGGAFAGIADDVTAAYWNVAGLARLRRGQATFMHANWLVDANFDYAAVALPVQNVGTFALHFTVLSIDKEPVRTVLQPEGTGDFFSGSSIALGASFAYNLTDRFSIGFTGKFINESIFRSSASTFAFDFGTLFTTPLKGMRLGAAIVNFGPKMKLGGRDLGIVFDPDPTKAGNNSQIPALLETDDFDLPLDFRVGVAMEIFQTESNRLTVALDANTPNNNTASVSLGTEYALNETLFLRAGYNSAFERDSETDLNFGGGIRYPLGGDVNFRFDYSFTNFGVLGNIHRFAAYIEF
ncbi:MAG: hypothetical protein D6813_02085 [Calditrichaeota bacterium]|nr:MAG: hypothetical protein D6813_02085 [Calditrichota bacterium]